MSFFGDLLDYNLWKGGDLWDAAKDDPERLFLGAMTPAGTELWNGVTGNDWDTELSWTGGSTSEDFENAQADGIDTGAGEAVGGIADIIAAFYGGGALAGMAGGAGAGASGGAAGSGGGLYGNVAGGGTLGGSGAGAGGLYGNVATGGTQGGGLYGQAATGGVQDGGGFDWSSLMDNMGNMDGGQQQQQQPIMSPQAGQNPLAAPVQSILQAPQNQQKDFSFKDWGQV